MKFNYLSYLEEIGVKECPQYGGYSDSMFYYRIINSDVQVGVRRTLDKWGNSIDFIYSIPKTKNRANQVHNQLLAEFKLYKFDNHIGEEQRI